MIAQHERRAGAAERERRERGQSRPGRPPSAEKPQAGPPEPHSGEDADHIDLPHDSAVVKQREHDDEKRRHHVGRDAGPFQFLHGILYSRHGAGGKQQKCEVEDPVCAVHRGRTPGIDRIRKHAEKRDPSQESARKAFPRQRPCGNRRLFRLSGRCAVGLFHGSFGFPGSCSASPPFAVFEFSSDGAVLPFSGSRLPTRKNSATARTTWK